ncbi:MAG TPA: filamentous hemagglutinin N-terminal domain-containing protein, partial [Burkholderiaceae bacterium]|nr:filamentous hemagglutinin N-terminal domain-containing protein [Burkholderiaceae bacterium]
MNQQRYRIVFNRFRSALMVVGEVARSSGKQGGRGAGVGGPAPVWAGVRPLVFSVWAALGFVAFGPVGAQVVADSSAAGTERPTVLNAPNGVPLVNIQTPSAAGVSRNVYSQFDVQQQGAILNNSRTAVATQQGGWVQGNPWLAKGSARVILNEVNSANPSQLRGYVEVAGQRAQVIIANPAGISCDGCGFINANRATLTTGQPIMNGGALEGYRVQRGRVEVSGAGLDASGADYADL